MEKVFIVGVVGGFGLLCWWAVGLFSGGGEAGMAFFGAEKDEESLQKWGKKGKGGKGVDKR